MMLRAVCAKGPFEESEVTARLRWVMWLSLRDLSEVAFGIAFLVLLLKRPDSDAFTIKLNLRRSLATSFGTPILMAFMPWSVSLESEIDGHLRALYSSREDPSGVRCGLGEAGFSTPPSFLHTYQRCDLISGWSFDGSNIVLDILVQLQNIVEWLFYYDSFV